MKFKELITEAMNMEKYNSVIDAAVLALKKKLGKDLPFLTTTKFDKNNLVLVKSLTKLLEDKFKKMEDVYSNSKKINEITIPFYKEWISEYNSKQEFLLSFVYQLNRNVNYDAQAYRPKDIIIINFNKPEYVLDFYYGNEKSGESVEDAMLHELIHLLDLDPEYGSEKFKQKIAETKVKDKTDLESLKKYYNLKWETLAYGSQYVNRAVKDITSTDVYKKLAASKNKEEIRKYISTSIKALTSILKEREFFKLSEERGKKFLTDVTKLLDRKIEEIK